MDMSISDFIQAGIAVVCVLALLWFLTLWIADQWWDNDDKDR